MKTLRYTTTNRDIQRVSTRRLRQSDRDIEIVKKQGENLSNKSISPQRQVSGEVEMSATR